MARCFCCKEFGPMRADRTADTICRVVPGDWGFAVKRRLAEKSEFGGDRRCRGKGQGNDQYLRDQRQTGQEGQRCPLQSQQLQQ